ncbi:MAG TPA: alpha/beta hydrolase [Patescibacteria group bacterium]|nr:alpha/beta hydrolase [Patescibacteria group bacterium]
MVEAAVNARGRVTQARFRTLTESGRVVMTHTANYEPNRNLHAKTAIVYIPGIFLGGRDDTAGKVAQPLAHVFDMRARAVSVEMSRKGQKSPQEEATGINNYLHMLTERQGFERFIMVGMSYGASVAISVAAHNERIAGLVLVSPRLNHLPRFYLKLGAVRDAVGTVTDRILHPIRSKEEDKFIGRYVGDSVRGAAKTASRRQFSGTISACVPSNPDTARIRVPVSIITGDRDYLAHPNNIIPDATYRQNPDRRTKFLKECYFRNAPTVSMDIIPGGRHGYALAHPYEVAALARQAMENMKVLPQNERRRRREVR